MSERKILYGGISGAWLLTIIFALLKVFKVITWGWIWIFAPLWVPTVLGIVAVLIFFKVILRYVQ